MSPIFLPLLTKPLPPILLDIDRKFLKKDRDMEIKLTSYASCAG